MSQQAGVDARLDRACNGVSSQNVVQQQAGTLHCCAVSSSALRKEPARWDASEPGTDFVCSVLASCADADHMHCKFAG